MPKQHKKVLVVDDDEQITKGAQRRLEAAGYEVFVARDGDDCVALALETAPDLVVMDVQMPRMDGLTALALLQANLKTDRIPVIMLSASLRDQQAALDAGARFFVRKPYHGQQLVAAVDQAMA